MECRALRRVIIGAPLREAIIAPRDTHSRIYAAAGRYSEAADVLLDIPAGILLSGVVEEAARLLRTAPATSASAQTLPRLGYLEFVYLYIGAPERALEWYEASAEASYWGPGLTAALWHPSYAALRKTERFTTLMRKAGLVDYWRSKAWPEFCRPVGSDDFVCD